MYSNNSRIRWIIVVFFSFLLVCNADESLATYKLNIVGSIETGGVYDVCVYGQYVYVAAAGDGLHVIDISIPTKPVIVGTVYLATPRSVSVSGSYAYVHADGDLFVIDISTPADPSIVGSVDLCGSSGCEGKVHASGDFAYVTSEGVGIDDNLLVVNISNPSNPQIVGSMPLPGYTQDVHVSGSYAYVASDDFGLQVVDISNSSNPIGAGSVWLAGEAKSVSVSGSYAYVAAYSQSGLYVVDISSPTEPTFVAACADLPGIPTDVYASDNYAYRIANLQLQAIDIHSVNNPIIADSINIPYEPRCVAASGSYVYVGAIPIDNPGNGGLYVVHIFADAPTGTTDPATSVTPSSATLNGKVNPNGSNTTYYFEYGADTSYGLTTETMSAGSGTSAVSVNVTISDLNPNDTYHYRIIATNNFGTSYGADRMFYAREKKAMPWIPLLLLDD